MTTFRSASKYLWVYTTPGVVLFSLLSQNWLSFTSLLVLFGVIPLTELFLSGSVKNLSPEEEKRALKNPLYNWILYLIVPTQYVLLAIFLSNSAEEQSTLTRIGHIVSMGLACGVLGINAAHELGHRKTKREQWMSKALLLSSSYMHFFIEHNRGHHKKVATEEDPASARKGESIYAFWWRSIVQSFVSAWNLEAERLRRKSLPVIHIENEMIRFIIYQLSFIGLIYLIFGTQSVLAFVLASLIGILLLESVNYIEHYGLSREKKGVVYEKVKHIHSWNSNHPLGRLLLLELSRHSDHHYNASRSYPILRHHDESPQMPTGYPGMMILALIPPLWFRLMHPKIDQLQSQIRSSH